MKKYLISFEYSNEPNNSVHSSIRKKLEKISPDYWVQLFPNSVAVKTDINSVDELYSLLMPEAEQLRLFIVEFVEIIANEKRAAIELNRFDY
ncbi:hypothetical protein [Lactococcus formosensis]|uniref:hypothetical protein n=1 Tax=Lactococcus formosensis TaxID=1281486 RepID=UPI00288D8E1E|nr:hypothetical protein [Lactococcus formosensis]MDT2726529.1 hypothetical protein [Lactococcus formosensis]